MNQNLPPRPRGVLAARRLTLLASAGLGVAVLFAASGYRTPTLPPLAPAAYAAWRAGKCEGPRDLLRTYAITAR